MFGHIDGLPMPYPRQYLARVMPQVPQTHGVRIRSRHANNVSQNCGHKNTEPAVKHVTSAEDRWLLARPEVSCPRVPPRSPGQVFPTLLVGGHERCAQRGGQSGVERVVEAQVPGRIAQAALASAPVIWWRWSTSGAPKRSSISASAAGKLPRRTCRRSTLPTSASIRCGAWHTSAASRRRKPTAWSERARRAKIRPDAVLFFVPDLLAEVREAYPEVETAGGRWVDAETLGSRSLQ